LILLSLLNGALVSKNADGDAYRTAGDSTEKPALRELEALVLRQKGKSFSIPNCKSYARIDRRAATQAWDKKPLWV
jgi:hypothetical protein